MKALVVYDSAYGNTRQIAEAIAAAVDAGTAALPAAQLDTSKLDGIELLIVGSPTQGGRPTVPVTDAIKALPAGALGSVHAAAFDTRMNSARQNFFLRTIMGVIGYAAPRIATSLKAKGATLLVPPEGFMVEDKEGPLEPGEAERAAAWARNLPA